MKLAPFDWKEAGRGGERAHCPAVLYNDLPKSKCQKCLPFRLNKIDFKINIDKPLTYRGVARVIVLEHVGRVGRMVPRKILESRVPQMRFLAFFGKGFTCENSIKYSRSKWV